MVTMESCSFGNCPCRTVERMDARTKPTWTYSRRVLQGQFPKLRLGMYSILQLGVYAILQLGVYAILQLGGYSVRFMTAS